MAETSSAAVSQIQSWPIARYARYINRPSKVGAGNDTNVSVDAANKNLGHWKHIETSDLILVLLESKNMILSSGNTIHENYSLLNASDWMRAISKGDSVLFACRIKNEIRRFRIQFKKTSHKTAIQHCHDCSHVLATYIRVKNANLATSSADGDSQLEDLNKETDTSETCRLNGEVSLQDVAKAVTVPGSFNLPIAYQHCNIQIPKEKLQALLRLCLADADFPAFVGCVEKELQEIINES